MSVKLSGIFPTVSTPFNEQGEIDGESLRNIIQFNLRAGVHGFIVAMASEIYKLSLDELERVFQSVIKEAHDNGVYAVVSTGQIGTKNTVSLSRKALSYGADAIIVAPPYFGEPNLESLFEHYKAISDAVNVPIIVQDVPRSTRIEMPPAFMVRLISEIEKVSYIKLESEPMKISKILSLDKGVKIFGGFNGNFLIEELKRGAIGSMPGCAYPEAYMEIWNSVKRGDWQRALEIHTKYLPLLRYSLRSLDMSIACIKEALKLRGVIGTTYIRPPSLQLDDINREEIKILVEKLNLSKEKL